ncbi:MAG: SDR family oxidoreductase [Verrucomicrobiales bacterium]|nr:SDR family oxidoreductase [Verrucomicrobiales bacterium]
MTILLTGVTGNIGSEVARQLRGYRVVELARGDDPVAAKDCEIIIHCAALTAFRAPWEELHSANVLLTKKLLDFAEACPRLRRFVHISTACVCGAASGLIHEAPLPRPSRFVNDYERSKWEAEDLVARSRLPSTIVRLSTAAGGETDGRVLRPGALHHLLFWLWKGLVPMIPGSAEAKVDLISTEHAGRLIVAAALARDVPPVLHACAGLRAPALGELLAHLAGEFAGLSATWRRGSIMPPELVDGKTFALFGETVAQSGDLLFQRVLSDAKYFLPALSFPRIYDTAGADAICEPAHSDWRTLVSHVTRYVLHRHIHARA